MENVLLRMAMKLNSNRRKRKGWQNLVRVLAVCVVFCTTYALIVPAITMEKTPECGIEAHVHTPECYALEPVMACICDQTVDVHVHDESCYTAQSVMVCEEEHTHAEACYENRTRTLCSGEHICGDGCFEPVLVQVCTGEHIHTDDCYEPVSILACHEEHAHTDGCYTTQMQLNCAGEHIHTQECFQPATELVCEEDHTHTEGCYQPRMEQICGGAHSCSQECAVTETVLVCNQIHEHSQECSAVEQVLTCQIPEETPHVHTDSCYAPTGEAETVLICLLEEHTHAQACYPQEEASGDKDSPWLCGAGEHTHADGCFDETGALICTVPEHGHTAACLVADLDLNADTEGPAYWDAMMSVLDFTGRWSEDLITVARSQVGYGESGKNLVLTDGQLHGYTRYGAKYADPYGLWSEAFVRFCLEYAGVENFPVDADGDGWITRLEQAGMYTPSGAGTAEPGDVIFLDIHQQAGAPVDIPKDVDLVAIVTEYLPQTDTYRVILGDSASGVVKTAEYSRSDPVILGHGNLPENPVPGEHLAQAEAVAAQVAALPGGEEALQTLDEYNRVLDQAGYEAYILELTDALTRIREDWEALDEEQKRICGHMEALDELTAVLEAHRWMQLPALETDNGLVSLLTVEAPAAAGDASAAAVKNGQTALFPFRVDMISLDGTQYGEAELKLELVLSRDPLEAEFDLSAMEFLREPVVTVQTGETEGSPYTCQVLTGSVLLEAATLEEGVLPGSFTAQAAVKVLAMGHNEKLTLQISAAMAQNVWDGLCQVHQTEEKRTVESSGIPVDAMLTAEQQQENYEGFLAECQAAALSTATQEQKLQTAWVLRERMSRCCSVGGITEEAYRQLTKQLDTYLYGDVDRLAESADRTNWQILVDSGWFEEYSGAAASSAAGQNENTDIRDYLSPGGSDALARFAARGMTSSAIQIVDEGGTNISSDNAVSVSKTIAPTNMENVFDITLDVITKEEINEVYLEPNMAVVIVLDISETMNSGFGSATRYQAAMAAAESFLDKFAANNSGASKIGFVAFNTDAYQIFALQSCADTATAQTLKNTMRTQTGKIINAAGYDTAHSRFTNMEAGLKMANDMLNASGNEHKYIIFLSDGFPTTYISSGYNGYDPYDPDGQRFYDSVSLYGGEKRPCAYGTSYSDTGAVRAREMAVSIKAGGTKIFSVGVDIGSQTISKYVDATAGLSYSVVDRRNTDYEIGGASSSADFKGWLQNSIGSGSGYYYDSTDTAGLNSAFSLIFEKIKELNAASSHLDWVTTDPMADLGMTEVAGIDFLGFYNKDGDLVNQIADNRITLTGASGDGWNYENSAYFDLESNTIHWDLKKSRYISRTMNGITLYECQITYRVRLKNEAAEFVELEDYLTNKTTALTYRIIDVSGGQIEVSERRTVEYPIPAVEGYVEELSFQKVDSLGRPLFGAEFTLSHDTAGCGLCRGDGHSHVTIADRVALSDDHGTVRFANIPSGHCYTLTETGVPEGFQANPNTYKLDVSYNILTVSVVDENGESVVWNGSIENFPEFTMPETGGHGIPFYTYGGVLILAVAAGYGICLEVKRRKGGAACRKK